MQSVIELRQVTKTYGRGEPAVRDVSLAIEPGAAVALLGPNGAGKTTAISIMLGLLKPSRGQAALFGSDPRSAAARRRIGVMLQGVSVLDRLTVRETIELFRSYYPRPLSTETLLAMAGLASEARSLASRMSGGQMRRLQFALAMAGDPEVLFLDEPTVGMDLSSRRSFWERLREYISDGKTLLLTTHDLTEADSVADRVIVMERGRVIADEKPERLKSHVAGRRLSFVAGAGVDEGRVQGLPGVASVRQNGRQFIAQTTDSDSALRTMILGQWDVSDIQVSGAGLEDVFVRLTEGLRLTEDSPSASNGPRAANPREKVEKMEEMEERQ